MISHYLHTKPYLIPMEEYKWNMLLQRNMSKHEGILNSFTTQGSVSQNKEVTSFAASTLHISMQEPNKAYTYVRTNKPHIENEIFDLCQ